MQVTAPPIERLEVACYRFPTEQQPESDGTLSWQATTAVTVRLSAAGRVGLGWTYSAPAAGRLITDQLAGEVTSRGAFDIAGGWAAMRRAVRNLGNRGLAMQAISAVDIAWWDLKARLLDVSLTGLLGRCRDRVPVYGSGGFTDLTDEQLQGQVASWAAAGCSAMKIKIGQDWGTEPERDLSRVQRLRELAGPDVRLMVDANGGYPVGAARRVGHRLDELGVVWFEEPVSSDDLAGLANVRSAVGCDVAAGEYVADVEEAARLLPSVDCLQLDATRCGGYTGWLRGAAVAAAFHRQVSGHCAPALHAPVAAAVENLRHVEWFVDHARLEPLLVEGVPPVRNGAMELPAGPGHGMTLRAGADRWRTG